MKEFLPCINKFMNLTQQELLLYTLRYRAKKWLEIITCCLRFWFLLEIKKIIWSHAHTRDLGTRDVFKNYDEGPHPFYMGVHAILGVLCENQNFWTHCSELPVHAFLTVFVVHWFISLWLPELLEVDKFLHSRHSCFWSRCNISFSPASYFVTLHYY